MIHIKVTGPTLHVFREGFGELAVDLWNSDKLRKKTQGKRKQFEPKGSAPNRTRETEREEFLRDWLKDVGRDSPSTYFGESESEEDGEEEEMEANVLEEDALEQSQENPPADFSHMELSEGLDDSDREDPPLGGMRSSDSNYSDEE